MRFPHVARLASRLATRCKQRGESREDSDRNWFGSVSARELDGVEFAERKQEKISEVGLANRDVIGVNSDSQFRHRSCECGDVAGEISGRQFEHWNLDADGVEIP